MARSSVESDIDELYGLPPERFIEARDRLAKQLRDNGKSDDAQRVKALRRPTVPAWAVNQVVRQHQGQVEELLSAGEELRRAQQRALSGQGGAALREASERRRNALRDATEAAEAVLEDAGRSSAPHLDAIRTTLEAASLEREAGTEVRQGRLVKELDAPAGFGDVTGLTLVQGTQAKGAAKKAEQEARRRAKEKREAEQAKARIAELRREAEKAEREATKAEREADRARAEAVRLRKAAEQARRKADRYSNA